MDKNSKKSNKQLSVALDQASKFEKKEWSFPSGDGDASMSDGSEEKHEKEDESGDEKGEEKQQEKKKEKVKPKKPKKSKPVSGHSYFFRIIKYSCTDFIF